MTNFWYKLKNEIVFFWNIFPPFLKWIISFVLFSIGISLLISLLPHSFQIVFFCLLIIIIVILYFIFLISKNIYYRNLIEKLQNPDTSLTLNTLIGICEKVDLEIQIMKATQRIGNKNFACTKIFRSNLGDFFIQITRGSNSKIKEGDILGIAHEKKEVGFVKVNSVKQSYSIGEILSVTDLFEKYIRESLVTSNFFVPKEVLSYTILYPSISLADLERIKQLSEQLITLLSKEVIKNGEIYSWEGS